MAITQAPKSETCTYFGREGRPHCWHAHSGGTAALVMGMPGALSTTTHYHCCWCTDHKTEEHITSPVPREEHGPHEHY